MDSYFSYTYFPFVVLAFRDLSSLRTHFRPFTEVLQEIRPDITRKVWRFFKKLAVSSSGDPGMAGPDRLEQKGTKRTNYWLADTNFTNSHQFINLFVTIRVIRLFTAAFPRRVIELQDWRVRPPSPKLSLY